LVLIRSKTQKMFVLKEGLLPPLKAVCFQDEKKPLTNREEKPYSNRGQRGTSKGIVHQKKKGCRIRGKRPVRSHKHKVNGRETPGKVAREMVRKLDKEKKKEGPGIQATIDHLLRRKKFFEGAPNTAIEGEKS